MKQPGLDQRHRDKNGEIDRKHGNTLISTLRQTHGPNFAPNATGWAMPNWSDVRVNRTRRAERFNHNRRQCDQQPSLDHARRHGFLKGAARLA